MSTHALAQSEPADTPHLYWYGAPVVGTTAQLRLQPVNAGSTSTPDKSSLTLEDFQLFRCPTATFSTSGGDSCTVFNAFNHAMNKKVTFPSNNVYSLTVPDIKGQYILARIPTSSSTAATEDGGSYVLPTTRGADTTAHLFGPVTDLAPPTNVRVTGSGTPADPYTLRWTKPSAGTTAIEGFNVHVNDTTPLPTGTQDVASSYARLDLDNDAEGANCPGSDSTCFYALDVTATGPNSNRIAEFGPNYFGVRTINRNGGEIGALLSVPYAYSQPATATRVVTYLAPVRDTPSTLDEFYDLRWNSTTNTATFNFRTAHNAISARFFIAQDRAQLRQITETHIITVLAGVGGVSCVAGVTCTIPSVDVNPAASDDRGTYYIAYHHTRVGSAYRHYPQPDAWGGLNNPFVFPPQSPAATTGLEATDISDSEVSLAWARPANATGFEIYQGSSASFIPAASNRIATYDRLGEVGCHADLSCTTNISGLTSVGNSYFKVITLGATVDSARTKAAPSAAASLDRLDPPSRPTVDNQDGVWTLRWTKPAVPANSNAVISGFDIHVEPASPFVGGGFIRPYARLDLAGANCPAATSACSYVINTALDDNGETMTGSGGVDLLGIGENYFVVRATNWSGSGDPSVRSDPSDATTTPVTVGATLTPSTEAEGAIASDAFLNPSWDSTAETGTIDLHLTRITFSSILWTFVAPSRDRLRTVGVAPSEFTSDFNAGITAPCDSGGCEAVGATATIRGLSAGTYYLAYLRSDNTPPFNVRWTPAHTALGGRDNPLVFPLATPTTPTGSVSATHGPSGVLLTWQKAAGVHSAFDVFYDDAAGVTSADNFVRIRPSCASVMDAGECSHTIPYAQLTDIDATKVAYFRIRARINTSNSELSATEARSTFPPLGLAATPRTLTFAQGATSTPQARTCESLPTVSGGGGTIVHAVTESLDWLEHRSDDGQQLCVAVGQQAAMTTAPDHETVTYTVRVSESPSNTASAEITVVVQGGLDTRELAKTALPDIVLAMADSTASGIKSRIGEVRRGCSAAAEFSLDGATDFASIVQSQAEYEIHGNRNWRKMLGNSKFAVSHDNDSADSGFCGVWGQGNFQNLDGEHSGVKWDGSLSGFSLGADTRLGSGKLLGIAVNNQSGAFDVTKDATTSQYDVAFSSVSPYLGWQSANGTDFHASLSVDSGAGEIKTSGNVTKHDLSGFGVGFGFRGSGALKGDLVYSSVTADESVADGVDISESVGVGRLRLAWERSRERVLASGASLNLNGEIGGRADTGTAGGGLGAELGFGFGYAKNSLKFGGNLRTLLFHSGDVGEFGAQIRLSIQPGQDRQGLSLNITPTYGQTQSGLANLWENGIGKITFTNPDSYKMRINAQLGFGFSLANASLVTPYATANYGGLPQFGLGLNWKPKVRDLELDLLGEWADSQQRVLLKGSLGF